jgi:hypothetical protein
MKHYKTSLAMRNAVKRHLLKKQAVSVPKEFYFTLKRHKELGFETMVELCHFLNDFLLDKLKDFSNENRRSD